MARQHTGNLRGLTDRLALMLATALLGAALPAGAAHAFFEEPQPAPCGYSPGKDIAVTLIAVEHGQTVSNVSLHPSETTTVIPVRMMLDRKTTLVLSSVKPVIFNLQGNTDLLHSVVLSGPAPLAVTGVGSDRLKSAMRSHCQPDLNRIPQHFAGKWNAPLPGVGNRKPDFAIGGQTVYAIDLAMNTGRLLNAPVYPIADPSTQNLPQRMFTRFPGGITNIPLSQVRGTVKASEYTTLPAEAGLMMLVKAKALIPHSERNTDQRLAFVVTRKVTLPIDACHDNLGSYMFLVPQGVPTPSGPAACRKHIHSM